MQSYIGGYGVQEGCMAAADIGRIRTAVEMYSDLGVDVHITEMAVRNYDETLMEEHAEFYGRLFEMFVKLNKDKKRITNISIWGVNDAPWMDESNGNYKQNSPYCGLYDEDYKRKEAYYRVLEVMLQENE
jgi:endo-1,4-beta-xylanase